MKNAIIESINEVRQLDIVELNSSCLLRECFDTSCARWNDITLDEKIDALKTILNEQNENLLALALGTMDYCTTQEGKDIKPIDLVFS